MIECMAYSSNELVYKVSPIYMLMVSVSYVCCDYYHLLVGLCEIFTHCAHAFFTDNAALAPETATLKCCLGRNCMWFVYPSRCGVDIGPFVFQIFQRHKTSLYQYVYILGSHSPINVLEIRLIITRQLHKCKSLDLYHDTHFNVSLIRAFIVDFTVLPISVIKCKLLLECCNW